MGLPCQVKNRIHTDRCELCGLGVLDITLHNVHVSPPIRPIRSGSHQGLDATVVSQQPPYKVLPDKTARSCDQNLFQPYPACIKSRITRG